jgi:hypothetical protein
MLEEHYAHLDEMARLYLVEYAQAEKAKAVLVNLMSWEEIEGLTIKEACNNALSLTEFV